MATHITHFFLNSLFKYATILSRFSSSFSPSFPLNLESFCSSLDHHFFLTTQICRSQFLNTLVNTISTNTQLWFNAVHFIQEHTYTIQMLSIVKRKELPEMRWNGSDKIVNRASSLQNYFIAMTFVVDIVTFHIVFVGDAATAAATAIVYINNQFFNWEKERMKFEGNFSRANCKWPQSKYRNRIENRLNALCKRFMTNEMMMRLKFKIKIKGSIGWLQYCCRNKRANFYLSSSRNDIKFIHFIRFVWIVGLRVATALKVNK